MTCHLCQGTIEIATNPKDTCYDVISGAKKKNEDWDTEGSGTIHLDSNNSQTVFDPIHKLEKDTIERENNHQSTTKISQLIEANKRQWSDPYAQSQKLRRNFRIEKRKINKDLELRHDIEDRHALTISLLPPDRSDRTCAKEIGFRSSLDTSDLSPSFAQANSEMKGSPLGHTIREATRTKVFPFQPGDKFGKPLQTMEKGFVAGRPQASRALVNYESDE